MSDHIERACTKCGSLLHHEDDCPVNPKPFPSAQEIAENMSFNEKKARMAVEEMFMGVYGATKYQEGDAIHLALRRKREEWVKIVLSAITAAAVVGQKNAAIWKLREASVGSCTCVGGTKTPDIAYHDELCDYRILQSAIAILERNTGPSAAAVAQADNAANQPPGNPKSSDLSAAAEDVAGEEWNLIEGKPAYEWLLYQFPATVGNYALMDYFHDVEVRVSRLREQIKELTLRREETVMGAELLLSRAEEAEAKLATYENQKPAIAPYEGDII